MYQILLADDECIFLDYMKQALDWEKYQCTICADVENGQQALDYIILHNPDVVFLDINMPLLDGIQVCERVRDLKIPCEIVITTAFDEFSFAYKAIKLGIADFLLKPFSTDELVTALNKATSRIRKGETEVVAMPRDVRGCVSEKSLVACIEAFLQAHYQESGLSINCIANSLHFENSYLRRVHKRSTGITITQRLENIRIQKAKEMLRKGETRVNEIAKACGFSDQFYFSKRFRQVCGCSPSEYRSSTL